MNTKRQSAKAENIFGKLEDAIANYSRAPTPFFFAFFASFA